MDPEERVRVILDAAERVLLSRGLQGTSMDAVAAEAGMSKRTLYELFDGRSGLVEALVRRLREGIVRPLGDVQQALPLAQRLRLLLTPERLPGTGSVALEALRAVIAEAPHQPDLAARMLEEGPLAVRRLIREELERGISRGEIALDDPGAAAALLHRMALPCPLERLLRTDGADEPLEAARARVDRAVAVFLAGMAAGGCGIGCRLPRRAGATIRAWSQETGATMTETLAAELQRRIDLKTKPPGSLGRIEALARRIGLVQGSLTPRMERCQLTIFAADHGIAAEGVSLFPQEVTRQMVLNFLAGGAAANVFARSVGADLRVVDAGVAGEPFGVAGLIERRIGAGTANFLTGPAMSAGQCAAALEAGRALGADGEWDAVAYGEMGIANTATAAALGHKLTGVGLDVLTGRGTGLDDPGLAQKRAVLERAAARTGELAPQEALAEYGGFEIAMMAGAMIGAAEAGRVVIVDGFIATSAALAAVRLAPGTRDAMVFAHRSEEQGHGALLDALGAEPLLSLGMRLGEGTGALLAWPLLKAAAAMLTEMASFAEAGVTGPA
mgnify:CR=1 FL=1